MHSPLDSIPHIFGRMHAPVHRRTCFQHIRTHTRSHVPSIVLLHFTSCPTFDDVTATLMGVRDWLTHHRYHRRHRCPTFDDVTATLMGVRDDVMTGNHYKVQKDYSSAISFCCFFYLLLRAMVVRANSTIARKNVQLVQ